MKTLFDRASMEAADTLDLEPQLLAALTARIDALATGECDLRDMTELVVFGPHDSEADLIEQVGFSPLVEPIDGIRFGQPGFRPYWDWLVDHGGFFELCESYGGGWAYVLFIEDKAGVDPELRALCRRYARPAK